MVRTRTISSKKAAGMAMSQYVTILVIVIIVITATMYIIRSFKQSGL